MGAWLAEQIVRAIEPEDPEERERYWQRGGFFTAPLRWAWGCVRAVTRDPEAEARAHLAATLVAHLRENGRRLRAGLPPLPPLAAAPVVAHEAAGDASADAAGERR